jgi:hypothetical protein
MGIVAKSVNTLLEGRGPGVGVVHLAADKERAGVIELIGFVRSAPFLFVDYNDDNELLRLEVLVF